MKALNTKCVQGFYFVCPISEQRLHDLLNLKKIARQECLSLQWENLNKQIAI